MANYSKQLKKILSKNNCCFKRHGKRDEAQDKAMAYGKEMMSRPELMKMRECGKMMAGMMPEMPFEHIKEETKNGHVCDDY